MSWKTRKRKAFIRYVDMLKNLPIYLIDKYIVIDDCMYFIKKNKKFNDNRKANIKVYYQYISMGKIKSSIEFDEIFNPDLTLDVVFEKNRVKADRLIKDSLISIGCIWDERIKIKYPIHKYTIILYYNQEISEWILDFFNGTVNIESVDTNGCCSDLIYLHK